MPYAFDHYKLRIPRAKDRRIKLTDEDREHIKKMYDDGAKIREIARAYEGKASRRLIQLILFPERAEHAKRLYKLRSQDGRYYKKERHKKYMKRHRTYKYSLALTIPKNNLTQWAWYHGEGRNANLGLWDGSAFHTLGRFFNTVKHYSELHWNDAGGTFRPVKLFSPNLFGRKGI